MDFYLTKGSTSEITEELQEGLEPITLQPLVQEVNLLPSRILMGI